MKKNKFWSFEGKNNPRCRLFCFPYAGGNSSIFWNWHRLFPEEFAILPLEMPGKGKRYGETPYNRLDPLLNDLAAIFLEEVEGDFALFGHSLGALIAFELARLLDNYQRIPKLLITSGFIPPDFGRMPLAIPCVLGSELVKFSDEDLINRLKKLNGTPLELLETPSFIEMILPALRADFCILGNYTFTPNRPLRCPILALGGDSDAEVPSSALMDWKNHTHQTFELKIFEGGHFFLHSCESQVVKIIVDRLRNAY